MADTSGGDGATIPEGRRPPWQADPEATTTPDLATEPPQAPGDEDPRLGTTIADRYRLEEKLGEGGMAVVYRAHDEQLNRTVAVKLLHEDVAAEAGLRARFDREARVLAALSHPNIVSLLDFGLADGTPFLVMELLRGLTLGELRDEEERVAWPRAVRIVTQIVAALNYAHREGLLHRDLKPDNVFLSELDTLGEHVQLLDFGFAKFVAPDRAGEALTKTGEVFGTPFYMAPEQLTGGEVDLRADLYAVGVMLFEMLARRRPFEGAIREVLRAKFVREPPTLTEVAPGAPTSEAHDAFFATALAREPDARFQTGAAMIEALESLPEPSLPTSVPPSPPEPEPRKAGVHPLLVAVPVLGGLALVAVCGASSLLLLEEEPALEVTSPEPVAAEAVEPDLSMMDTQNPWVRLTPWAPEVEAARRDMDEDGEIERAHLRDLRAYSESQPADPLAKLLLGRVFTARGMRALAVSTYEDVLRTDPSARHDPQVVVDLVRLHAAGFGEGPARLLREHFGADALPVVAAAADVPDLDLNRRRRLEQLRESLLAR